jgi:hypothetical protein
MMRKISYPSFIYGTVMFLMLLFYYTGCGPKQCKNTPDCPAGELCINGTCQSPPDGVKAEKLPIEPIIHDEQPKPPDESVLPPDLELPIESDGGDIDRDPVDEPPPPTSPKKGDVVINEVMFDPPLDLAGDANKDGVRDLAQDDFVEIVNKTDRTLNLANCYLEDIASSDGKQRKFFTFPAGALLPPNSAAVVFGGWQSGKTDELADTNKPHPNFGGAYIYTFSAKDGLITTARKIVLKAPDETVLDEFEYGTNSENCPSGSVRGSLNRYLELEFGTCRRHAGLYGTKLLFSPGTWSDGRPFSEPPPEPPPPPPPVPKPGDLVINELMFDPPAGTAGDANKDGTRDATNDDFIEIVNVTNEARNLEGVFLENDADKKVLFTFLKGVYLPGRTAVVIFGGGMGNDQEVGTNKPHSKFSGALVYKSSALSLTIAAKKIMLRSADKELLDHFEFGLDDNCPAKSIAQSINRSPDLQSGTCIRHTEISPTGLLFSPGAWSDGRPFTEPPPIREEIPIEAIPPEADGGNGVEQIPELPPVPDLPPPPPGPKPGDVIINEVLFDPPLDAAGDANKDGKRDAAQDDFVEIINISNITLNLEGTYIDEIQTSDSIQRKLFTFPKGALLPPKGVAVIFGGGMSGDTDVATNKPHPKFSGAYVYKLAVTNGILTAARTILIKDPSNIVLDQLEYGTDTTNCPAGSTVRQSLNRKPDLGSGCFKHSDISTIKLLFSPGTDVEGNPF